MKIRVAYHDIQPNGYREFAQMFVEALRREYAVVTDTLTVGHKKSSASGDATVNIVVTTPEHFQGQIIQGATNLGYTMWESSRIRPDWAEACNLMQGIIVPALNSKEALIRSGVTVPIHIVPPFVDLAAFPAKVHSGVFTFLSIFQWGERKDPETLLRAYWEEFSTTENVRLIIKTWPFFGETQNHIKWGIEGVRRSMRLSSHAKLTVLDGNLPREEILGLHALADCYVSSHHGEGWSMPLMDAMASGTPCVATGYGGNLAFMNAMNSFLVDYTEVPAEPKNPWLRSVYGGSTWAQADLTDLRTKMRAVFESSHGERLLGQLARHDMAAFSVANTAAAFRSLGP